MLKKAGIVVAVVAAATVAAAPLAFAGDAGGKSHHASSGSRHSADNDVASNTSVDNSADRDQRNRCVFIQNQESTFSSPLGGVVPLLGDQLQTLNCANFGDITVVDLDGPDVPPQEGP